MKRALFLIQAAGLLVPLRRRGEWSREWLAELHFIASRGADDHRMIAFAWGAFQDALWHGRHQWDRDAFAMKAQTSWFCLAAAAGLVVLISIVSGLLPVTRSILLPLPYGHAEQIAIVSQAGAALATQSAVRAESAGVWQHRSKLIEGAAAYLWRNGLSKDAHGRDVPVLSAHVSDSFFPLLGVRTRDCDGCLVLSYNFWQSALRGAPVTRDTTVTLDGRRYPVAGVLEKRFWFLSRDISLWTVVSPASFDGERTGVVVRLSPGVSAADAERELSSILQETNGGNPWSSLIRLTPLEARVRSVLGSFGLALVLAFVIAATGARVRVPKWSFRGGLFFAAKTFLLLASIFLAEVEFTHAASITMLGGGNAMTELLSTWLSLLGCMGALIWSVRDQEARCRVCLRRLGLQMRVGCPGCLLLDWAGTELVCMEGHGMLHVPEMVSCWHEPERWTSFDDSWQGLFERS